MVKKTKKARKTTKKKTVRKKATKKKVTKKKKAVKKRTTKKRVTKKKTVKKTTKKKVVRKKKAATKKKTTKKKVAKKKVVRKKKATKKKVTKKKVAKRKPVKKKAPAKKKAPPKKKPTAPLFERIVPTRPPEPATGDNPYNIKIVNMVASANFNVDLDLFALAREVDTIEYEPEQFPGAILKLQKPRSSLLLFKNGKVICTGARSEVDVERALLRTTEIISRFVS